MPFSSRAVAHRLPLGRLTFELFLVFMAVGGALFANAWWQARAEMRGARAAMVGIEEELAANRLQISARIDHHRRVAANAEDLIVEIAAGGRPPSSIQEIRERLTEGQGLRTPILSRAAWDGALVSGRLRPLAPAEVRSVSRVYEVQRRLDLLLDALFANFVSPSYYLSERLPATATSLVVTFQMIVEIEAELLNAFEEHLGPAAAVPAPGAPATTTGG